MDYFVVWREKCKIFTIIISAVHPYLRITKYIIEWNIIISNINLYHYNYTIPHDVANAGGMLCCGCGGGINPGPLKQITTRRPAKSPSVQQFTARKRRRCRVDKFILARVPHEYYFKTIRRNVYIIIYSVKYIIVYKSKIATPLYAYIMYLYIHHINTRTRRIVQIWKLPPRQYRIITYTHRVHRCIVVLFVLYRTQATDRIENFSSHEHCIILLLYMAVCRFKCVFVDDKTRRIIGINYNCAHIRIFRKSKGI